jgi:enoyl-CoA hydratase/carnithine racemase
MQEHGVAVHVNGERMDVVLCDGQRRNAQTPAMWDTFAAIEDLVTPDIRVIVLRSEGPSFSAGLDRAMMTPEGIPGQGSFLDLADYTPAELDAFITRAQAGFTWWQQQPAITIAAVQGHAIGAGMQLALACDLIIAQEDAQFAMRETSLGLVPDLGGTRALVQRVGYPRALEMCGTGRFVDAAEAYALGIAQFIAPDGSLEAFTNEVVASFALAPFGALQALKPLLHHAIDAEAASQLAAERSAQIGRFADIAAALRAP